MSSDISAVTADSRAPTWQSWQFQRTDVWFLLLAATLSTLLGYQFAAGNQLEQLPIIMRQLDADYLSRDFFLNTADSFGPRSYFVWALGWLCQWLPLAGVYLGLTWLTDLMLAGVTLWVAGSVLGGSRIGAMLAVVLSLGLSSFHLGDATQIRYEVFQPASLALPLALAAVGCGLSGRPLAAALLAALASLPHPLYGAEGGGLALGLAFVALLLPPTIPLWRCRWRDLQWRRALLYTLAGALILGAALVVFWWLPYRSVVGADKLPLDQFFHILAYYRAPHHYLPSQFRSNDFISAAAFVVVTGLCIAHWARAGGDQRRLLLVSLLVLMVLVCCLAGYLLVEVWPLRAALTLQLFRLLSLLKWIGFMLLGSVFADYLLRPRAATDRPLAAMALISTGVAQPLLTAMVLVLLRWRPWRWLRVPEMLVIPAVVLVTLALNGLVGMLDEGIYLLFALALVAVASLNKRPWKWGYAAVLLALCVFLLLNRGAALGISQPALAPVLSFQDHRDVDSETAREIARVTPASALLLVPPHMGIVRAIGGRAIVVDYKSIPFQDTAMLAWYQRMNNVFGAVDGGGFKALAKMDCGWRRVSDQRLLSLAAEYGADYALLWRQTETQLPVVFSNQQYQLVRL